MPIYEYQCSDCGHELEVLQKISDPVLTECPNCAHSTLKKKISAAAFRLKGGGWYETDFKKSGKKNLAGDGKSAAEGGAAPAASASAAESGSGGAAKEAKTKTEAS